MISGSGRTLKKEMATRSRYSCLENSMDRRAWQATVHGVTESDTTELLTHFWPQNLWDLSSSTRDQTHVLCVGRWSLHHWASWEVHVVPLQIEHQRSNPWNKYDKLTFIKTSALQNTLSRELEDMPQRKYLQKTHLIKDCYPNYTKNS